MNRFRNAIKIQSGRMLMNKIINDKSVEISYINLSLGVSQLRILFECKKKE